MCGVLNLVVGKKVIIVLVGVKLVDGIKIKKSKLCGEEFNGMLCVF